MKVGLVGAGRIGSKHAEVVAAHAAVTALMVADDDPRRAEDLARSLPGSPTAEDLETLLGTADALVIATPTPSHADLVTRAVRAGISVFCEKPLADSLERTREVVALVAASDVMVQVGFQRRFDAGYAAARRALQSGDVGDVRRLHALSADPAPPPEQFIASSGGIFRDLSIHDFDALRWLTGLEVEQVFAVGSNRGPSWFSEHGDVDEAAAIVTFTDGTLATVQASRFNGAGYDVRLELAGTSGTVSVGHAERAPVRSMEPGSLPNPEPWQYFWDRFQPAYEAELRAFLDAAASGGPSPCSAADALEALLIAEAADLSRREARPVTVAEVRQRA